MPKKSESAKRSAELRKRVEDKYGRHLARKASPELLSALARSKPRRAAAEAMPGAGMVSAVLEFKARPEAAAEALRRAASALPGSEATAAGREAARWAAINRLRDLFQREAAGIRGDLEARTVSRAAREGMMPGAMRAAVQMAWLIRSIRAPLDPKVLADLAAAGEIHRIDLPRRLEREIDVSGPAVGAPSLRAALGATGKGVVVAVIDSEVLLTHRRLADRVTHKENYTLEAFGNPDDHGTAVAGIIASADEEFMGMAPEALVQNYKVLATDPGAGGDDFSGALAIQRALEDGARIANCSWGVGPASDGTSREARACDAAWDLGLALVKSAGNRGPGPGTMTTPADARGVIVVGGTSRDGTTLGDYSSRGPAANGRHPDLVAPGGTKEDGIRSCRPNGKFGNAGFGTSYAAPHVSGLLAVLLESDPLLTPDELRARLIEKCRSLDGLSENEQGAGLLDFS